MTRLQIIKMQIQVVLICNMAIILCILIVQLIKIILFC